MIDSYIYVLCHSLHWNHKSKSAQIHKAKEKAIKEYNYKKLSSSKVRQKKGRKENGNCKSNGNSKMGSISLYLLNTVLKPIYNVSMEPHTTKQRLGHYLGVL